MSLIWRNPSEGMNVILNLCVTLLNREYFGDNKSFVIKRALFNSEHVTNGNSSLIKVADLLTHRPRFTDANGEFQVSIFQDSILMPLNEQGRPLSMKGILPTKGGREHIFLEYGFKDFDI